MQSLVCRRRVDDDVGARSFMVHSPREIGHVVVVAGVPVVSGGEWW